MSAVLPRPTPDLRPAADVLRWAIVTYTDGELGNGLDSARDRLRADARKDGKVVAEFIQSPVKHLRAAQVQAGQNPQSGDPVFITARTCRIYVVAVLKPAPPEKWVRLTSTSGAAAVEVMTVESVEMGKPPKLERRVVKVEQFHPEDMRAVSMGYAMRALEGTDG